MNRIHGSRLLVTGGAGFIGSAIVEALQSAGAAEIRVLDNLVSGARKNLAHALECERVTLIEGDIRDAKLVSRLTEGADYVFHEAALRMRRCAESPRQAVEVMINGTQNVLDAAVRCGVRKVIAASCASVYGDACYLPMGEEHPFNNRTLYGAAKIANEQMLRSYYEMYGLNYVALRYFNVYGPRMDLEGVYTEVMIRWLDALDENRRPCIYGDGLQTMDFVYVHDVARANLLALENPVTDEVFNVGTGIQTSSKSLCELLLNLSGSNLRPEFKPACAVANVKARRAGTEKAEKMIGFRAAIRLEQGLRELIHWRAQIKEQNQAPVYRAAS